MVTIDRYFELSDIAGADPTAFQQLVALFAEQAVVRPAGQSELTGKDAIAAFYRTFFERNIGMHHVWATRFVDDRRVEATWAVAGNRQDGTIFALQGIDRVQLDDQGRILDLEVLITR